MTRRLANVVGVAGLASCSTTLVLQIITRDAAVEGGYAFRSGFLVPAFSLVAVGWIVARHRPSNPIGWLFTVGAVSMAWPVGELGVLIVERGGRLPGWFLVAEAIDEASWVWLASALIVYLPLLFPDGRPPSPRWRVIARIAPAGIVGASAFVIMDPARLQDHLYDVPNPLHVSSPLLNVLAVSPVVLIVSALAAIASVVWRFRRSQGVLRQQLKWFVYAALPMPVVIFLGGTFAPSGVWRLPIMTLQFLGLISMSGLGVAVAIAILRYRLFEIDRIINRTVVYAAVTALLAGGYTGAILLFGAVSRPLTGGSDLAVAAATIVTAAAFRPVRRRVQAGVDRRFNRSRYDAARTLAAFGARLRDEVDLASLRDEIDGVVRTTMLPATVSLWLAPVGHAAVTPAGNEEA